MKIADLGDVQLHYRVDGPDNGPPIVFANSLGTDLRLWDDVLPMLPPDLKVIRYDKRGHGLSSMPRGPYHMGALVSDVEIRKLAADMIEPMADAVMERWISADFRATPELQLWRNMLIRQPAEGYAGCSSAIAGTDFYTTTASLRLPALGIAGSEDGSTPPDLVRETIELIPGSRFHLIRGAGHLPCVENPEEYANVLKWRTLWQI